MIKANYTIDLNRLPYGNPDFSDIRKQNMIYVDKTKIIANIASQRAPIFFSRPRRFGKSLLINTLSSLFTNGLQYFHRLDIEKMWNDKTYQVVHLDFSGMAENTSQEFKEDLGERLIRKFKMDGIVSQRNPNIILDEICEKLDNNSIVLLIDEYDAPLIHNINNKDNLCSILKILNNFYATIKQYTGKFRLIFITGITKVISIFSSFNNLIDISLDKDYNTLLGFTQDDLNRYFDSYITNAAQILNMNKDDIYQRLEQYYDGFQFALAAKKKLCTILGQYSVF